MPRCVDFCPLANGTGQVKKIEIGEVLAANTTFFGHLIEMSFRRLVNNGLSAFDGFHLEPVGILGQQVPVSAEATCELPVFLRERVNKGGAGTTNVSLCPHISEKFEVFATKGS
jgi:hypothetical protein